MTTLYLKAYSLYFNTYFELDIVFRCTHTYRQMYCLWFYLLFLILKYLSIRFVTFVQTQKSQTHKDYKLLRQYGTEKQL